MFMLTDLCRSDEPLCVLIKGTNDQKYFRLGFLPIIPRSLNYLTKAGNFCQFQNSRIFDLRKMTAANCN